MLKVIAASSFDRPIGTAVDDDHVGCAAGVLLRSTFLLTRQVREEKLRCLPTGSHLYVHTLPFAELWYLEMFLRFQCEGQPSQYKSGSVLSCWPGDPGPVPSVHPPTALSMRIQ